MYLTISDYFNSTYLSLYKYKCLFYKKNYRQVIVLNPELIKAGTEQMKAISTKLERNLNGMERHQALLLYYNQSSIAKEKAIW